MYKSEAEFLKHYDSSKFEKLSLTTDILIISIANEKVDNYRKTSKKNMSILLVKRDDYPFKDKWCLPGGFLDVHEDLDNIYLEQLYTFGDVHRDPRMRIVSTAYMALIDKNRLNTKLMENASWFNVSVKEENGIVTIILDNGKDILKTRIKKTLKDKTTDRYKFEIVENNDLAFDHALVILSGIERLKNKIMYTDIVFNMMPQEFTLGELQQVYEVILNKKLLDPAFRRIIANKVEATDDYKTGEGHRPSRLFRYKKD